MRFVRYAAGAAVSYGLIEGDAVRGLASAPFGGAVPNGEVHSLSSVRLLAPCVPSKVFALAYNLFDHLSKRPAPKEPQVFIKLPTSVIGPGAPIVLPRGAGRVDEEAELVVVMGRTCRNVLRADALDYVFGYTCGNDVSAREWQKNDLNWWRAKASDTFAPLGPVIVTDIDPADLRITGRVNGKTVQESTTAQLIFDIPSLIEWISSAVTLEPGDLIYTGTPGSPAPLSPGDTVEVEIAGIGVLSNPVT